VNLLNLLEMDGVGIGPRPSARASIGLVWPLTVAPLTAYDGVWRQRDMETKGRRRPQAQLRYVTQCVPSSKSW
jgi:hypothetical protein